MKKEIVDMHQVIKENLGGFEPVITERGGVIHFESKATLHIVHGDQIHLFNAVRNLLDNAIKYCEKTPEVIIATSNTQNQFTLTISDNGIGMSKAERDRIFNKFYRVKRGDRHDVKRFGLGLSYVKNIIRLHHGSVEVRSDPGYGSVFIVHLPLYEY